MVICICFRWADDALEDHTWKNTTLLHIWTQWQARGREGEGELEKARNWAWEKRGEQVTGELHCGLRCWQPLRKKSSISHAKPELCCLNGRCIQEQQELLIFLVRQNQLWNIMRGQHQALLPPVGSVNKYRISELRRQLLLLRTYFRNVDFSVRSIENSFPEHLWNSLLF